MTDSNTGAAPVSTGEEQIVRRVIKRRPARKQVELGEVEKKQLEQTGQTYK